MHCVRERERERERVRERERRGAIEGRDEKVGEIQKGTGGWQLAGVITSEDDNYQHTGPRSHANEIIYRFSCQSR